MSEVPVDIDNFVRAETGRMFAVIQHDAGGVNRWLHYRVPTPVDRQTVIRMNRDTLYSAALVDISAGATVTIPDGGRRYLSVMVVNQDHYVNRIFHQPGTHDLTVGEFATPYVVVAARVLVDPANPDDVAAVNALQDQFGLRAGAAEPLAMPAYDRTSFDATRAALLDLAKGAGSMSRAFGRKDSVDPVHHLVATAAGWGGLPESEAAYVSVSPDLPAGEYQLAVRDVPVDGFWSVSLYNADGSITIHFGGCGEDRPNCLPIMDGWNYLIRLYRPHAEILNGTWTFPAIAKAS